LALFQLWFELAVNPAQPGTWKGIAGALLTAADGFVGTHLLLVWMRRRRWPQKPWPRLVLHLVLVILVMSAVLSTIDSFGHHLWGQRAEHHNHNAISLPLMLVNWGNWTIVLVAWTGLYFAIHEVRERRRREVHDLKTEMVAQQAQLRGLRAQLNPHFFFNCLNSLRELIEEDPERAQLMVTQLSQVLRYSLQSHGVELVSFAEEIRAVEDYLALEATRFEERLRITWDIAPEARCAVIPPMILQTLVENAVKHGIARRPRGGEITIRARVNDGALEMGVVNSGKLSEERSTAGVGLRNASERLSLLYGSHASLLLESISEERVRALVRVPLRPRVLA